MAVWRRRNLEPTEPRSGDSWLMQVPSTLGYGDPTMQRNDMTGGEGDRVEERVYEGWGYKKRVMFWGLSLL